MPQFINNSSKILHLFPSNSVIPLTSLFLPSQPQTLPSWSRWICSPSWGTISSPCPTQVTQPLPPRGLSPSRSHLKYLPPQFTCASNWHTKTPSIRFAFPLQPSRCKNCSQSDGLRGNKLYIFIIWKKSTNNWKLFLESFGNTTRQVSQIAINFVRWCSQN